MTQYSAPPRSGAQPTQSPANRPQLRRSRQHRVIAGVCGGFGDYLGIDPVVVRIVMVALIFAGVGVLAYIVGWIVMPDTAPGEPEPAPSAQDRRAVAVVVGAGLIAIGGLQVMRYAMPGHHDVFWPIVLVVVGVAVLLTSRR
jgi:phage shock protein C